MPAKKRKAVPPVITFFILIFSIVIFLIPLSAGAFIYFNAPPKTEKIEPRDIDVDGIKKTEDGAFYVEVRKGESARSVGNRLEKASIISSRYFWNFLCRIDNSFLKTGTYKIEPPITQLAIHRLLVSGRQVLQRVTIPEGVTLNKTAVILEKAGVCSAEDFLEAAKDSEIISSYLIPNSTMEGYLFPDTYFFPLDYPAAQVVTAMADTFFSEVTQIYPEAAVLTPEELNKKVIIASIVEREYRAAEEAPLMAAVFFNRLRIGMALQSCATVEYIITEIQGQPHPKIIYSKDLEIRSPFNTYLHAGLPPSPISAPGTVALRAVFFPADSNYLYFRLVDVQSGRHYFARTLEEHNRAGALAANNSFIPKGGF